METRYTIKTTGNGAVGVSTAERLFEARNIAERWTTRYQSDAGNLVQVVGIYDAHGDEIETWFNGRATTSARTIEDEREDVGYYESEMRAERANERVLELGGKPEPSDDDEARYYGQWQDLMDRVHQDQRESGLPF